MMVRALKRAIRYMDYRVPWRYIRWQSRRSASGREMPATYYDEAFNNDTNFQVPFYKSSYYGMWLVIVDRCENMAASGYLTWDVALGNFAALVEDWEFSSYVGIDFSNVAIRAVQVRVPRFRFQAGDVRDSVTYQGLDFDAITCMEVLEHIEDDLAVLSSFPAGTRCLITVPNFPWKSHVRHFDTEDSVFLRYGEFFHKPSVTRLKGVRNEHDQFYLMDGICNAVADPVGGE